MPSFYRKVIKIRAEDSPNVRLGLAQMRAGQEPTGETLVPGVLGWREYLRRRQHWDKVRQSIGLDAEFWKGGEVLLYPPDWLNRAEHLAMTYPFDPKTDMAEGIGVDPAEGDNKTSMSVVGHRGLFFQSAYQTPDTRVIIDHVLWLMREYNVPAKKVMFDRGGGGKQLADFMRSMGYPVQTVGFGESVAVEPRHSRVQPRERREVKEERYEYTSRRAQMYGLLRELLDPVNNHEGFSIPGEYHELRRQLGMMPLLFDGEGRMYLPPKRKRGRSGPSLDAILGCSPDEADSLVLGVYAMLSRSVKVRVGAIKDEGELYEY
jgi:hypothetical protein